MPFDLQLSGRSVLITGGSRGLGRALALACAQQGMQVAICARTRDALEEVARAVRECGAPCVAITADLSEAAGCQRAVEAAAEAFGKLDVLINNASTRVAGAPASIMDMDDAHLTARFMGKTMAAIRCAQAAAPVMRAGGEGRIVCIGGTAARTVLGPGETTAKNSALPQGLGNSALSNFCKYLSDELAPDRITVNIVHPHTMFTPRMGERALSIGENEADVIARMTARIPLGRLITADDVVGIVLFLASPWASAITGQSIAVDGGALRGVLY